VSAPSFRHAPRRRDATPSVPVVHAAHVPLVTAAYLVLCAALLAGFVADAHVVLPLTLAGALPVAWLAVARRDVRLAALTLVALAGAGAAADARRRDAACRERAARLRSWQVALSDIARPGETARGHARGLGCPLRVTLVVRAGAAAAGAVVLARGHASVGDAGALIRDAVLVPTGERDLLPSLRASAGASIDRQFGTRAPLVRALVVADARGIDPEVRDAFAAAGLVHALSVSGLHVAIVAEALVLVLCAARVPRRAASLAAVGAVLLYVALLGWPAPAVRAGGMLALDALARVRQRATSPWAVFAAAAALPLLLDPRAALDLGYQLSVSGMAALVAGRSLARAVVVRDANADGRPTRPGTPALLSAWMRRASAPGRVRIARELLVGTLASVVTAPLVAWHFGQVSLVGPVANLVAAPVLALLQPALFLAVLSAPLTALGTFAAGAAAVPLDVLGAIARAAAQLPGAAWSVTPSGAEAMLAAAAALAGLVAAASTRARRPALVTGAAALTAVAWAPLWPGRDIGVAELHLLDVGQGDAVAVRTRRGRWVLVDAGRRWNGGDAGARTVVPWLRRRGGALAALMLTHPHADHVGGAATVLARLQPAEVWDPGFALGSNVYHEVLTEARRRRTRWRRVAPGDSLVVDDVVATVLAPDSVWTASLRDPNLASLVLSVRIGRVRILLTGDAESPEEAWLLERASRDPTLASLLRADVLKVGHHGSRTSTTPAFLAAVRPRLALVSVGAGNAYGHPSAEVMQRLADGGARVVRTDQSGPVIVRVSGARITVETRGERWELPARSDAP
jgi:competence protein ComEC